jgi:hypothetical protein
VHPDALPVTATAAERAAALDGWTRAEARKLAATLLASLLRAIMDSAATVFLTAPTEEADIRAAWHPASPSHPAAAAWRARRGGAGAGAGGAAGSGGGAAAASGEGSAALVIVPPTPGPHARRPSGPESASTFVTPMRGGGASGGAAGGSPAGGAPTASVRALYDAQAAAEASFYAAVALALRKSARSGLAPLFESGYVHRSGAGIAHFLRLAGADFAPEAEVGD